MRCSPTRVPTTRSCSSGGTSSMRSHSRRAHAVAGAVRGVGKLRLYQRLHASRRGQHVRIPRQHDARCALWCHECVWAHSGEAPICIRSNSGGCITSNTSTVARTIPRNKNLDTTHRNTNRNHDMNTHRGTSCCKSVRNDRFSGQQQHQYHKQLYHYNSQ